MNRIFWLVVLSMMLAGCAAPVAGTGSATTSTPKLLEGDEALQRDAETMAGSLGISVDEAIRRLQQQDDIGRLGAELESQEAGTFAGLWIQQTPTYHVIVAFTRDGEKTITRYVSNTPLAGVIEVLDRNGQVVARVGEQIRMGGGEIPLTAELERQLREPLPKECPGPYWLMGQLASHN